MRPGRGRRATAPSAIALAAILSACGAETAETPVVTSDDQAPERASEAAATVPATAAERVSPQASAGAGDAVAPPAPEAAPERTRLLRQADDDTVGWLVLDWTGGAAPIDRWAEAGVRVGANGTTEFNRAERIAAEAERFVRARDAARGYGRMRVSLRSRLSEYDADYGEFYVSAFSPGSGVVFQPFQQRRPNPLGGGVRISFANAGDAFVLPVPPDEAEALVARLGPYRDVTVNMDLTIEEVNAGADDAEIVARIDRYGLVGSGAGGAGGAQVLRTVELD